jgi:hypothetical protein
VAELSIEAGHNIDFNYITILGKVTGKMDRLVEEAIEIRLHPNNFNRDGGITLSRAWQPVTNMLKQSSKTRAKQRNYLTPPGSSHWLGSSMSTVPGQEKEGTLGVSSNLHFWVQPPESHPTKIPFTKDTLPDGTISHQ